MRLGDLDALKEKVNEIFDTIEVVTFDDIIAIIDNAPTVKPKLSEEQIEKITDLLETEWGYEGIREDVSRILRREDDS